MSAVLSTAALALLLISLGAASFRAGQAQVLNDESIQDACFLFNYFIGIVLVLYHFWLVWP